MDEGADIALKTVDQKAGLMSKIIFVLLDDDIYDGWVKKAKQLGFTSLDGIDEDTGSPDRSNNNNESTVKKHGKTTADRRKEHEGQDRDTSPSRKPDERRIIDASSPNKSDKGRKNNADKSPERAPADTDQQLYSEENTEKKKSIKYVSKSAEYMLFTSTLFKLH